MTVVLVVLATLSCGAVATVLRFVILRAAPVVGLHGVNVVGTVLLAVVVALLNRGSLTWPVAVIFGVGFSGALTTFSTWIVLIDQRRQTHPWRTLILDVVLPSLAAVGLSVATFIVLG